PPRRTSSPAPPIRWSSPPRPQTTSSPPVPSRRSAPGVPTTVQVGPEVTTVPTSCRLPATTSGSLPVTDTVADREPGATAATDTAMSRPAPGASVPIGHVTVGPTVQPVGCWTAWTRRLGGSATSATTPDALAD